jgi:hypothetical protein
MSAQDLDTLAKAPLFVHLAITGTTGGPTPVDSARFNEHVEAANEPNARICGYTEALKHLANNFQRLYSEIAGLADTGAVIKEIQALLDGAVPFDRLMCALNLGRVAAASVRDDTGNPVPARVAAAGQLQELFRFMEYPKNNERFTDELQITNYWPGTDPALRRFTDAELRQLSSVYGCLYAAMSGCHGGELGEGRKNALKQCLLVGYTPGQESCAAHALLRYFDQLFWLVYSDVQYAEKPKPVFVQGRFLVSQKFTPEEQAAFYRHLQSIVSALVNADSPPMAHSTVAGIMALMQGQDVEIDQGGLSEGDWDVLSMGYLACFLLVAAADGSVGRKEMEAFGGIVNTLSESVPVSLVLNAAARIPGNMHRLWPAVTARGSMPPQMVLDAVVLASTKFGEEDFLIYRSIAMAIAVKTAQAEGGGFLGLGSKISKDEQKVLDGLKKLLGLA